ncbi:MAG: hypothetical protein Q8933_11325 [Bacteroidota bacterium]|nr:hypothetical protein [Bacteroidota bacterium]
MNNFITLGKIDQERNFHPERKRLEDVFVVVLFNFRGKLPELLAADLASMTIDAPLNIQPVQLSRCRSNNFRIIQGSIGI